LKRFPVLVVLSLVLVACGQEPVDVSGIPDLEVITVEEFESHMQSLDKPAVVNVWASWCIPCRSEAPLLNVAVEAHGDQVVFIGVDVQDSQTAAKRFLAEFGLDFQHFFDRDRSIPNHYAAFGTPITLFFDVDGQLVDTHQGVIDERGLALGIDELLAG
jgi:cytochrome c biogenesis protein CcmG/thiol:disulfide interchange protein DsbE